MKTLRKYKIQCIVAALLIVISVVAVPGYQWLYRSDFRIRTEEIYANDEFAILINDYTRLLMAQQVCGNVDGTSSFSTEEKLSTIKNNIKTNYLNDNSYEDTMKELVIAYLEDTKAKLAEMPSLQYYGINTKYDQVVTNNKGLSVLTEKDYSDTEFSNYEFVLVVTIEDNIVTVEQEKGSSWYLISEEMTGYSSNNQYHSIVQNYILDNFYPVGENTDDNIDEDDIDEEDEIEKLLEGSSFIDWTVDGDYTFVYAIKDHKQGTDAISQYIAYMDIDQFVELGGYLMYIACIIIGIISLVLGLLKYSRKYEPKPVFIPVEVKILVLTVAAIYLPLCVSYDILPSNICNYYYWDWIYLYYKPTYVKITVSILGVLANLVMSMAIGLELAKWIKKKGYLKNTCFLYRMITGKFTIEIVKPSQTLQKSNIKRPLLFCFFIMTHEFCVVYATSLVLGVYGITDNTYYQILLIDTIVTIIILVYVYRTLNMLYAGSILIEEKTKEIVEGKIGTKIEDDLKELNQIKENINQIDAGLQEAIDEAVKSQSMKTELITNVSHDLKTPLTSIVSYVDLLKKDDCMEEQRKEYIDILETKSNRLKVLIEDLFEMSKAASKDIKLSFMELNIVSLTREVLVEFEQAFDEKNLKLNISYCNETMKVNLDGQKTYRIIANLVSNIVKYTLPDTRVYVVITTDGENVILEFKNISAIEITHQGKDLMERFVREDKSRNTEGSGLGLAIAKSLTELQHGTMQVDADADLFKVRITFPLVKDEEQAEVQEPEQSE